MFKKISFALIVGFSLLNAFNIQNGAYMVLCEANNYSVAPNVGKHRYLMLLKSGKLFEAMSLRDGRVLKKDEIYAYKDIIKTIKKANSLGKYKANIPNTYIYLDEFKEVPKNSLIYPQISRKKELRKNFIKWISSGIDSYKAVIYDSRYANLYPEGIEITVKNNKIVKAQDARSAKVIDLNKIKLYDIRDLFGIVKWGLDNDSVTVDYDRDYGFANYIKLKDGLEFGVYSFKPL